MSIGSRHRAVRIALIGLVLLVSSAALVFGQAGWKTATQSGFSYSYPADWNPVDLGVDESGGMKVHTTALCPPSEPDFSLVVMVFPAFTFDLKAEKMSFKDFMKSVFENLLADGPMKGLKIEETDAVLRKGRVPGFMVMEAKADADVKAAIVCGDLVKGKAALLVITMNLPAGQSETGRHYLDQAGKILASFTFPK